MRNATQVYLCPNCSFQTNQLSATDSGSCPDCGTELEVREND